MAGTMVHLGIGMEILKKVNQEKIRIQNPKLFIGGNVCPDGIHSREGYTREMKMITHFRQGISDHEFHLESNRKVFHQRVKDFWLNQENRSIETQDLYLGYIVHLLTDEYFMCDIRPGFMKKMREIGLTYKDQETFSHFSYDVNQIDFRLAREYPGVKTACRYLEQVEPYEIKNMLSKEELNKSREWILGFYFPEEIHQAIYLSYEKMVRFIKETGEFMGNKILEHKIEDLLW